MNFQNSNFTITRDNVRSYKITGNFRIIASLVNRSFRFDKQFFQRLIISYATEKFVAICYNGFTVQTRKLRKNSFAENE